MDTPPAEPLERRGSSRLLPTVFLPLTGAELREAIDLPSPNAEAEKE
jgi:hypothetical protein